DRNAARAILGYATGAGNDEASCASNRVILRGVVERDAACADVGSDIDRGCSRGGVVKQHRIAVDEVRRAATGNQLPVFVSTGRANDPIAVVQAGPLRTVAVDVQGDAAAGVDQ